MAQKPSVNKLIALAEDYIGTPYQWGGTSPRTGFDCSGFVQWLYGQQGIQIPRVTYTQVRAGVGVAKKDLRPGDILFFEPGKNGPGHEGLYIGGGKFIEAPHTGASVRVSSLASRTDYVTARRILNAGNPSLGAAVNAVSTTPSQTLTAPDTGAGDGLPTITPPVSTPPPTALGTPGADVELPGSTDYTLSPHHEAYGLWQQAASGTMVSPETMQMVSNAQLSAGLNAAA